MTDVPKPRKIKERFSRFPVSSFSPSLLAVLLKGSREQVRIPCPDQRTMQHVQARIHALRTAMRRENHPQYTIVTRARTSRTWDRGRPDSNCVLVIQPHDVQFDPLIKAAGVDTDPHMQDLLDNIDVPTAPPEPTAPVPVDPYSKFKDEESK
jgi:hypothetical protein